MKSSGPKSPLTRSELKAGNWLNRIDQILEQEMINPNFNVELLAKSMGMSQRQLFRKMKAQTQLTPLQYLRQLRLNRSHQLLQSGTCRTVKEAAFQVGYMNTGYYIQHFERTFGCRPLEVLQRAGWR